MKSLCDWPVIGADAPEGNVAAIELIAQCLEPGGWSGYPPYSELAFNPPGGPLDPGGYVGFDWIDAHRINWAVTIYKMRCPGIHPRRRAVRVDGWLHQHPYHLCDAAADGRDFAAGVDRYLGFHFFTNTLGGNMMNYANPFWLFGHPEVYILILPAFGVAIGRSFRPSPPRNSTATPLACPCDAVIALLSFTVRVSTALWAGTPTQRGDRHRDDDDWRADGR